jgi:hypothetical protein
MNALVLYDTITVDDDYKQRVVDITEFFLQYPRNIKLFNTNNLTPTLSDLANQGFTWAFVSILGHCVDNQQVFTDMIADCERTNSPIMGHIVYRPNSYPHMDNQFFVVNLPKWTEVGSPAFENVAGSITFTTRTVTRSAEDFHDDYTPFWVAPGEGESTYTCWQSEFARLVVQQFVEAGYTIQNIRQDLRDQKWNLYANANRERLEPLFNEGTFNHELMPQVVRRILNERDTLADTVYILNSELVYGFTPKQVGPVDHYIGVAGGFKSVLLLNLLGFTENTTVTYSDVSKAGLDYQRYLVGAWDGNLDNYINIVKEYQAQHPEYRYAWRSWNPWDSEIAEFLTSAGMTQEQFQAVWQEYRKLKFNYLPINLLDDTDQTQLADHIADTVGEKVYIWASNAFDMQWTRFLLGKTQTETKFDSLMSKLKQVPKKITVESCAKFYNSY